MLLIYQIPIVDLRNFILNQEENLSNKIWRNLELNIIDNDIFLRSIGLIKRRYGINPPDENFYCDAKNAIRFTELPKIKITKNGISNRISIKLIYKKLFYDGKCSGKYEIGFSVDMDDNDIVTMDDIKRFYRDLIEIEVNVPITDNGVQTTKVKNISKLLTKQLFYATTPYKVLKNNVSFKYIYSGKPFLFIEMLSHEKLDLNAHNSIGLLNNNFKLHHSKLGSKCKLWCLLHNKQNVYRLANDIRISVLYMNSYRESLHMILKKIAEDKLLPEPRSRQSNELQAFIKRCFENYFKDVTEDKIDTSNIIDLSLKLIDDFSQVERKTIKNNLKYAIDVRRNYFHHINKYLEKIEEMKKTTNITIGNIYNSNVNIGEIIKNNKQIIKTYGANNDIKETLNALNDKVKLLLELLDDEPKKRTISETVEGLIQESVKEKPNKSKWQGFYNGLSKTIKTVGEVGVPILKILEKLVIFFP